LEERIDFPFFFPDKNVTRSPRFDKKKYIIIVSRVHAGETPASYMLKGILEYILE